MRRVYGMKVIILIRGDLSDKPCGNPVSDDGLNGQKSAEAIVVGNSCEGPNVRNREYQGVREQCKDRRKLP